MTKQDLKTGMRVRTRDECLYLVIKDVDTYYFGHQNIIFVNFNNQEDAAGESYNDDLTHDYKIYDIIEVYTTESGFVGADVLDKTSLKSIWKREDKKKMTVSEIEKKLGYEVEIVREI